MKQLQNLYNIAYFKGCFIVINIKAFTPLFPLAFRISSTLMKLIKNIWFFMMEISELFMHFKYI